MQIRAKSVIKVQTASSNIDYEYNKGTDLKVLIRHLATLVIVDIGPDATSDLFDEIIKEVS